MKPLPDSVRPAYMKESMARAIAGVRAILTPEQLKTFDAAVTAHKEHQQQMQAAGRGKCSPTDCTAGPHPGKPRI